MGRYPVYDFYDNPRVLVGQFAGPSDVPPLIKEAADLRGAGLDNSDYALIIDGPEGPERKFPVVDPGNTALSVMALLDQTDRLPQAIAKTAARNLVQACLRHDLVPPEKLVSLVGEGEGNRVKIAYFPKPVKTAEGSYAAIRQAVTSFEENARTLHPRERRKVAMALLPQAERLGIQVGENLKLYAAPDYSPERFRMAVDARAACLLDGKTKTAELRESDRGMDPEWVVNRLFAFDKEHGLDVHYGRRVPDPYYVYGYEKRAVNFTVGGSLVSEERLRRVATERKKLVNLFGDEFADAFSKDPVTVFASLPLPHKKVLAAMTAQIESEGLGATTQQGA